MSRRAVIFGGAPIEDYDRVRARIKEVGGTVIIACDSGLRHMEALGITPDLIVGDFDSHEPPTLPVETIRLPCEKDDTDTVYAVRLAVERGCGEFILFGVVGGRLDHTLGNVSILLWLAERGLHGVLVDDYSEMELITSGKTALIPDRCAFFSLIALFGAAESVAVRDAKYPLEDARIGCDYQYGVSNEVLPGKTASVYVGRGSLLLVRVRRG